MYEDLVQRLRERSIFLLPHHGETRNYDANLMHEAADALEELRKAVLRLEDESGLYDELPTFYIYPTKWIAVTERLPEEVGKYLVCGRWKGKQTEIWVCEFMTLGFLKGWANNAANPYVTHWMPLPEPPKEEEK